jgi:hypothetical protein
MGNSGRRDGVRDVAIPTDYILTHYYDGDWAVTASTLRPFETGALITDLLVCGCDMGRLTTQLQSACPTERVLHGEATTTPDPEIRATGQKQ